MAGFEVSPERIDHSNGFQDLRRAMIGTSMVPSVAPEADSSWGPTCLEFLDRISSHPSKASKSYYLKNHLQYFRSLSRSLSEISRVLVPGGICALVVQDSHYKNVHNDLPQILIDMGLPANLRCERRVDFENGRTMAGINPRARRYRLSPRSTESVLFFARQ